MKFTKTDQHSEQKVIRTLEEIANVQVRRATRTERVMVTGIPKWVPDDEVLDEIISSNIELDASEIKAIKVINRNEYTNKRIILEISGAMIETFKQKSKISVAYETRSFRWLRKEDKKCLNCGGNGHNGFRREEITDEQGNKTTRSKLICSNAPKCLKCKQPGHNLFSCNA